MTDAQAYKAIYGDIIHVVDFYRFKLVTGKYNLNWEENDELHEEPSN